METTSKDLPSLLEAARKRSTGIVFEGYPVEDQNLPGNLLIVESAENYYSFSSDDILNREDTGGGRVRVWVRVGAQAFEASRFSVGMPVMPFYVGMEHIAPPPSNDLPGMPVKAKSSTHQLDTSLMATLAGVGSAWTDSCVGGDSYDNNCAHFLSDAFIRAGFTELNPPNSHINARCSASARRPIRARDMWSWFQSKARRTSRTVTQNTGWWAIFQLDGYWGGHVVVLDSDAWIYYGTGWHGDWNQWLYQW